MKPLTGVWQKIVNYSLYGDKNLPSHTAKLPVSYGEKLHTRQFIIKHKIIRIHTLLYFHLLSMNRYLKYLRLLDFWKYLIWN